MGKVVYIIFGLALFILLIDAVIDNHKNPPGGNA